MKLTQIVPMAAIAVALIAGSARAEDWTGAHSGVTLSYSKGEATGSDKGPMAGVGVGYDFDFGNVVVGGGLEYNWSDVDLGGGARLKELGRLKLRAGLDMGQGLVFASTGVNRAKIAGLGRDSGYFFGVGYEHKLSDTMSLSGEVIQDRFDNFNGSGTDARATSLQMGVKFRF